MAENLSSKWERRGRWFRNVSLGAAALELAIVAVAPETATFLNPLIILNLGQAAVGEIVYRTSGRKPKIQQAHVG
jgi:hypothetical protein